MPLPPCSFLNSIPLKPISPSSSLSAMNGCCGPQCDGAAHIQAVIFDLDGTLLDTGILIFWALFVSSECEAKRKIMLYQCCQCCVVFPCLGPDKIRMRFEIIVLFLWRIYWLIFLMSSLLWLMCRESYEERFKGIFGEIWEGYRQGTGRYEVGDIPARGCNCCHQGIWPSIDTRTIYWWNQSYL